MYPLGISFPKECKILVLFERRAIIVAACVDVGRVRVLLLVEASW